ncbi:motile sperm domain-containing protein 2-like [Epargyreus clarus]|uniref:motile sperm domain-containing protein 2-like n=1 Tax=Epargyreus clarus TaxID=520877 RepID=UPI003C2CB7A3
MSKLSEIRALFEAKLKSSSESFDPRDLERVKSDKYLYRVLEHYDNDVQLAVDMLWEIMVWRKTEKINEITEKTVNIEYVREGLFFPRGRDIDSCLIFIMKSKIYVKGQKNVAELKKVIIYWLERLEREEDGKKITVFFDMDGCGLSNMDIDIVMYMVTLFKNYYPNFVNYIIVFQLPWILSAGFKIVKSILPAKAVEKLKTIGKDKLKEIVAPEQALTCWGGKDDYVFEFIPEKQTESTAKKVTFKENGTHSLGELLSLSTNIVEFKTDGDEISGEFTIKNMDDSAISFKIRTTSPEKYRVRPSSGLLGIGAMQTVIITVQPGFNVSCVNKDRFLVLALQIPKIDISQTELSELWQSSSKSKVDEYRLKCQSSEKEKNTLNHESNSPETDVAVTIKKIHNDFEALNNEVSKLRMYQIVTIFLSAIVVLLSILIYREVGNEDGSCTRI